MATSRREHRAYDPQRYAALPDAVAAWSAIAQRQAPKDQVLVPRMAREFVPGRVLELGGGVGQIALLLRTLGHDVTGSDYHAFFVAHQRGRGIDAHVVDATDIAAAGVGRFANVFAHSITPFITHDAAVLEATYRSAFEALLPGGRLVMLHAMEPWRAVGAARRSHERLARAAGFEAVSTRRDQLLPTRCYAPPWRAWAVLLERLFASAWGSRFLLVATRPSQPA